VRRKDVLGLMSKYLYTWTSRRGAMLAKTAHKTVEGVNQTISIVRVCPIPGFIVGG
jgi:hypothetical protein